MKIKIYNLTDEEIGYWWNNEFFNIKPHELKEFPSYIAQHLLYHLQGKVCLEKDIPQKELEEDISSQENLTTSSDEKNKKKRKTKQ
jgi:hypothetical protein